MWEKKKKTAVLLWCSKKAYCRVLYERVKWKISVNIMALSQSDLVVALTKSGVLVSYKYTKLVIILLDSKENAKQAHLRG